MLLRTILTQFHMMVGMSLHRAALHSRFATAMYHNSAVFVRRLKLLNPRNKLRTTRTHGAFLSNLVVCILGHLLLDIQAGWDAAARWSRQQSTGKRKKRKRKKKQNKKNIRSGTSNIFALCSVLPKPVQSYRSSRRRQKTLCIQLKKSYIQLYSVMLFVFSYLAYRTEPLRGAVASPIWKLLRAEHAHSCISTHTA